MDFQEIRQQGWQKGCPGIGTFVGHERPDFGTNGTMRTSAPLGNGVSALNCCTSNP